MGKLEQGESGAHRDAGAPQADGKSTVDAHRISEITIGTPTQRGYEKPNGRKGIRIKLPLNASAEYLGKLYVSLLRGMGAEDGNPPSQERISLAGTTTKNDLSGVSVRVGDQRTVIITLATYGMRDSLKLFVDPTRMNLSYDSKHEADVKSRSGRWQDLIEEIAQALPTQRKTIEPASTPQPTISRPSITEKPVYDPSLYSRRGPWELDGRKTRPYRVNRGDNPGDKLRKRQWEK